MPKHFYVYFLSNNFRNVLYIGVTSDLARRVEEHKLGLVDGFTKRYRVKNLVYFEEAPDWISAISREKELKGWKRWKKDRLIDQDNPSWRDLSYDFSK